jgi:RNA polymerase sigma-70 factor (ECF subfamily)
VHAEARNAEDTDWRQIVGLYGLLLRAAPSPVVELNRAVGVAICDDPAAGIDLIDAILTCGKRGGYLPAHAARASYERALALAAQESEQRFLRRRLDALPA